MFTIQLECRVFDGQWANCSSNNILFHFPALTSIKTGRKMQLQTETNWTHFRCSDLVPFIRAQIPYRNFCSSWKIVTQSIAFEKAPFRVFVFSYEISEVMPKYADSIRVWLFKTKSNEKAFDNSSHWMIYKITVKKNVLNERERACVFSDGLAVAHITRWHLKHFEKIKRKKQKQKTPNEAFKTKHRTKYQPVNANGVCCR